MSVTIGFVDERKSIKIAVSPEAHAAVKKFSKQYDMSEQAVASRIYLWFVEQDDVFQRAVVGLLHGVTPAMEAGLADHVWELSELVSLLS